METPKATKRATVHLHLTEHQMKILLGGLDMFMINAEKAARVLELEAARGIDASSAEKAASALADAQLALQMSCSIDAVRQRAFPPLQIIGPGRPH